MRTCLVYKHILHVCWYFWRPEEDVECSGTKITGICETPTSSERIVLLATEPFSPAPHSLLQWINNCILTTGRRKRKWAWSHKTESFTTVCHIISGRLQLVKTFPSDAYSALVRWPYWEDWQTLSSETTQSLHLESTPHLSFLYYPINRIHSLTTSLKLFN